MAARTSRKAAVAAPVETIAEVVEAPVEVVEEPTVEAVEAPIEEPIEAETEQTEQDAEDEAPIEEAPAPLSRKDRVTLLTGSAQFRAQVEWVQYGKRKVLHLNGCPHYTPTLLAKIGQPKEVTTSQVADLTWKVCTDCGTRAIAQRATSIESEDEVLVEA